MHLDLAHDLTPKALAKLNQELEAVLFVLPVDEVLLQQIIIKRANLVESLLNDMDVSQRRCFASQELTCNNTIIAAVDIHRQATSVELAKVNKASKAIKKYHQV